LPQYQIAHSRNGIPPTDSSFSFPSQEVCVQYWIHSVLQILVTVIPWQNQISVS
jgi:hypothetical protein